MVSSDFWPEHGSHARVSLSGQKKVTIEQLRFPSPSGAQVCGEHVCDTCPMRRSSTFKAAGCLRQVDGGLRGNGASTTAGCLGHVHGGGGDNAIRKDFSSSAESDARVPQWERERVANAQHQLKGGWERAKKIPRHRRGVSSTKTSDRSTTSSSVLLGMTTITKRLQKNHRWQLLTRVH